MRKTRDLERTRKEILGVAFMEVLRRGFQGVSVDDIVGKTQFTKGAFYHQFPTKNDLGYALVDEVIKPMITERWITPLESYENPLLGILQQMKKLIGESPPAQLKLGCPLNNLVQEMAPVDAGFRRRLQAALDFWVEETDKHLRRAKKAGILLDNVKTRDVAHFIVMAHEGMYGLLKGLNDPRAFEALYASLSSYFQTLTKTSLLN